SLSSSLALARLAEQRRDANGLLSRPIVDERKLGDEPQVGSRAELAAKERLRVLECLHRRSRSLLVAEDAHVDLGTAKIGCDLDRGHGRESDARVAQLFADERAQLALKQGVDPVRSLVRHG